MRRRLPLALLAAASLIALTTASAPVARADGRAMTGTFEYVTDPWVQSDLCLFPVSVVEEAIVGYVFLPKADGTFLEQDHGILRDTFSANGRTLVSEWTRYHASGTMDAEFTLTSAVVTGGIARVVLPDGSVFWSAGRVDYVGRFGTGWEFATTITPDRGHSGDVAAFCAALSS